MERNNFINYLIEFPNFLSLFIFAFFIMSTSPILLDISNYFGATPENMNLIVTFFWIGSVTGTLTSIFIIRRINKVYVVTTAYILTIPSLISISLTTSLLVFYILYFISGYFLGIIFINANTSMVEGRVKNKDSVVNLGHSFFAVGALTAPFLASGLVNRQFNWKIIYYVIIIFILITLTSYIIRNKKVNFKSLPVQKNAPLKEAFKYKGKNIYLLFTLILMLFYMISEVTTFSWAPTFFRIEKMFNLYSAGFTLSILWIGMLIGRSGISYLSYKYKLKADHLLIGLTIVSIVALVFTIYSSKRYVNFIGIGFIGLGFSGIGPLLISTTGSLFGKSKDIALTILFLVGQSSGALSPFFIKLVSNRSLILSMAMVIIFMGVFIIVALIRMFYIRVLKSNRK